MAVNSMGIILLSLALVWVIFSMVIMYVSFNEDDCFSRWWPRWFAIMLMLQGLSMLIYAIVLFMNSNNE